MYICTVAVCQYTICGGIAKTLLKDTSNTTPHCSTTMASNDNPASTLFLVYTASVQASAL